MLDKKVDFFICYETTTGKSYAEHFKKAVEKLPYKFKVFLAASSILSGNKGKDEIEKALQQCKFFIVIITASTVFSEEVKKEIKKAKKKLTKSIIYAWFKGVTLDDVLELGLGDIQHPPDAEFETKEELANIVILEVRKILKSEEIGIKAEKDPEEISRRGYILYTIFNFHDAIKEFDKALSIDPNHVKSLIGKGNALVKLNKEQEALKLFNKAIELDSNNAYAQVCLGGVFYRTKRYKESLDAYEEAIRIKPDYHLAWNGKGSTLFQLKQYKEALDAYNEAIRLSPTYFWPWVGKGNVYFIYGIIDESKDIEAIIAYKKVTEIKTDFPGAWWRLARIYARKGDKGNMLFNLKKAVELDPKLKAEAKITEEFRNYWDDPDFKKIVN